MQPTNRISLHTNNGIHFFDPQQIIRLEAKSNYTKIYFADHLPMLLAKVLKEFETMLVPFGFVRTHHSHLVNKDKVMKITAGGCIVMNDNSVAEISRRKKIYVMKQLSDCRLV